jgi:hypothetical protein
MSPEPSIEARWRALEAGATDVAPRAEAGVRVHVWLALATAFTMWLAHGPSYAAAMLLFLLCHEGGHYLACRMHGVSATLPFFIPAPPIFLPGTLGAVIRVRSPFPNRNALFDMGAAGPWGGFVIALPVLAIGLRLSTVSAEPPLMEHAFHLGDSLITALMTRLVLGEVPESVNLVYHPLAFATMPANAAESSNSTRNEVGSRLRITASKISSPPRSLANARHATHQVAPSKMNDTPSTM